MPVQLTLPRKDTSRTLRCDDRALTVAFQMGRPFFLRRPVRDTHQLKNRYMHVDYGALEKDGTVLSASSAFPKCKSCTLNCTLGELAVLRLIADNPRITQKGLAAVIGISERTVKTRTVELQQRDYCNVRVDDVMANGLSRPRFAVKSTLLDSEISRLRRLRRLRSK